MRPPSAIPDRPRLGDSCVWGDLLMTQASSPQQDRLTDIATTIALAMQKMGVVGLPRNYEIFYEALTGTNEALSTDFRALGQRPRQEALDKLSVKYFTQNARQNVFDNAHDQVARKVDEIMVLLTRERNSLEKFGVILDQTSGGLSNRHVVTRELLQKIIGIMAAATDSTIEQGRQIFSSIADKSAELEEVKGKLEEYKRLADTDPLTKIWNRRAFDKKISAVYDEERGVIFSALILADIDCFKAFNDRYGHPVGDRILQTVATLLKANTSDDVFVARTGGEEFALIVDGLTEDATVNLAEELRLAIEKARYGGARPGVEYGPITISLGVCMASDATGADDLYAKADRALYASKVAGRNKVTRFSSLAAARPGKNWLLYRND